MSPLGTQKSGTKAAHEKETLSFLWAYHLVYDKSLLLKQFKRNKWLFCTVSKAVASSFRLCAKFIMCIALFKKRKKEEGGTVTFNTGLFSSSY